MHRSMVWYPSSHVATGVTSESLSAAQFLELGQEECIEGEDWP
jgi:hypothetical protein